MRIYKKEKFTIWFFLENALKQFRLRYWILYILFQTLSKQWSLQGANDEAVNLIKTCVFTKEIILRGEKRSHFDTRSYWEHFTRGVDVNKRTVTKHSNSLSKAITIGHIMIKCLFSLSIVGHILTSMGFALIEWMIFVTFLLFTTNAALCSSPHSVIAAEQTKYNLTLSVLMK